jgi:hypothetical protein
VRASRSCDGVRSSRWLPPLTVVEEVTAVVAAAGGDKSAVEAESILEDRAVFVWVGESGVPDGCAEGDGSEADVNIELNAGGEEEPSV